MKNNAIPTCPGCGKHCPLDHPRCKYGRAFFEKWQRKEQAADVKEKEKKKSSLDSRKRNQSFHQAPQDCSHKWEQYVEQGGLAWQFFLACCHAKKALRKKRITEEKLFSALSDDEKAYLSQLIEKMDPGE